MNTSLRRAGLGIVLLSALPGQALAQRAVQTPSATVAAPSAAPSGMEDTFVYGGDLASHLQAELTSAGSTAKTGSPKGTMFDDTDTNVYANYATWLSLYGNLHLERNRNDNTNDYFPKSNTFFRSEGLTMRQLFAAIRPEDDLTLYGGKIHPNFGSAFESTPGNFYNFASDYEQSERIGFGMEYRLPEAVGLANARVSLETFYLDTTPLSISLLSQPKLSDPTADRPRRFTRGQFGAANTGTLDSYTLSLRGGRPETGITYQASYTEEATADPAGKTERGASFGLMDDPGGGDGIALGHRLGVIPFVEYAQFANFGGTANLTQRYLVGGLAFHYVRWELDVAGGLRKASNVPQSDGSTANAFDRQESISLNYTLMPYPQVTAGMGLNHANVAGQGNSWSGGPSLSTQLTF